MVINTIRESDNYKRLPHYYSFIDDKQIDRKNDVLMTNFRRINGEIETIVTKHFKNETK